MKLIILAIALLSSCRNRSVTDLRLNDIVEFQFKGRNLFYSDACDNVGVVIDQFSYEPTEYHVRITCGTSTKFIWIKEQDVLKVLKLGND